jgi:hypothetical protein
MKNHFFVVRHKYKLTRHKISAFFFFICTQHNTNQPIPTYIFRYTKKEYQSNTFLHMQRNNTNRPLLTFLHTQRNYTNKSQLTIKPHKTYPSHFSMKNHFFLFGNEYKLTGHKIFTLFFLYMHTTQHQPTTIYDFTYAKKQYQPNPTYIFAYAKKQYQPIPTYIFIYAKKQYHQESTNTKIPQNLPLTFKHEESITLLVWSQIQTNWT